MKIKGFTEYAERIRESHKLRVKDLFKGPKYGQNEDVLHLLTKDGDILETERLHSDLKFNDIMAKAAKNGIPIEDVDIRATLDDVNSNGKVNIKRYNRSIISCSHCKYQGVA